MNSFTANISAAPKTPNFLISRKQFPAPRPKNSPNRQRKESRPGCFSLSNDALRRLSQFLRGSRCRRLFPRQIPQDAHSRRSAHYEKFYFTPGDLGFPNFDTKYARVGVQNLLGPVVSRRFAHHRSRGANVIFLSHQHRLASARKSAIRRRSTRRLEKPFKRGHRHRQRRSTPRSSIASALKANPKKATPAWNSGQFLRRRSLRPSDFRSLQQQRRNSRRRSDPAKKRRNPRNWPFLRDRRIDAYQPILNRWLGDK